jgi:hypothetical protein
MFIIRWGASTQSLIGGSEVHPRAVVLDLIGVTALFGNPRKAVVPISR